MEVICGQYVGNDGSYWVKAVRGQRKVYVLGRKYSPSLQNGWSVWREFDNENDAVSYVKEICRWYQMGSDRTQ